MLMYSKQSELTCKVASKLFQKKHQECSSPCFSQQFFRPFAFHLRGYGCSKKALPFVTACFIRTFDVVSDTKCVLLRRKRGSKKIPLHPNFDVICEVNCVLLRSRLGLRCIENFSLYPNFAFFPRPAN